jgi:hypothetical protein
MDNLRISGISKLKEQRAASVMKSLPLLESVSTSEIPNLRLAPKYVELQRFIQEFRQGNESEEESSGYGKLLHNSLQKLVTEIEFTKPKKLQMRFLDKVYSWYRDKLNCKSASSTSAFNLKSNSRITTAASTRRTRENCSQDGMSCTSRSHMTEKSLRFSSLNDCRDSNSSPSNAHKAALYPVPTNTLPNNNHNEAQNKEFENKIQARIKAAHTRQNYSLNLHKAISAKVRCWSLKKARREEGITRKLEYRQSGSSDTKTYDTYSRSKSETKSRPETKHIDFRDKLEERPATSDPAKQLRIDILRRLFKLQQAGPDQSEHLQRSNFQPTPNKEEIFSSEVNPVFSIETPIRSVKRLHPAKSARSMQLVEVDNVKRRLAKHSITCSAITLHRALVIPDDIPHEKLRKDFPEHGKLISNPLFEKIYSR